MQHISGTRWIKDGLPPELVTFSTVLILPWNIDVFPTNLSKSNTVAFLLMNLGCIFPFSHCRLAWRWINDAFMFRKCNVPGITLQIDNCISKQVRWWTCDAMRQKTFKWWLYIDSLAKFNSCEIRWWICDEFKRLSHRFWTKLQTCWWVCDETLIKSL